MAKLNSGLIVILLATLAVSGCSRGTGKMMNLTSGSGPDEFAIVPSKPLVMPDTYAELPAPTPEGANLSDPTPNRDAVVALGGSGKRYDAAGVPRSDQGMIAAATRYGVAGNIRTTLAAEDLEFRKKNKGRVLERLFNVTTYFKAYEEQSLDRYRELQRLRRKGVRTPAAPPEERG